MRIYDWGRRVGEGTVGRVGERGGGRRKEESAGPTTHRINICLSILTVVSMSMFCLDFVPFLVVPLVDWIFCGLLICFYF